MAQEGKGSSVMPKDLVILWKINPFISMSPSFIAYNPKLVKCLFFSSLANKGTVLLSVPLLVKADMKCSLVVRDWHMYHQGCNLSNQILPDAVVSWSCFSHPAADVTFETELNNLTTLPKNLSNTTSTYPKPPPCRTHHGQDGPSGSTAGLLPCGSWLSRAGFCPTDGLSHQTSLTHLTHPQCYVVCTALFLSWLMRCTFFPKHSTFFCFLVPTEARPENLLHKSEKLLPFRVYRVKL